MFFILRFCCTKVLGANTQLEEIPKQKYEDNVKLLNDVNLNNITTNNDLFFYEKTAIYITAILFSLCDVLIMLLQGSGIKSLSWDNIKLFFTSYNIFVYRILFFFVFWFVNLFLLFTTLFFVEHFCKYCNISPQLCLLIVLVCVIFRVHSWVENTIFFLLGVFSPMQEFMGLFWSSKQVFEYIGFDEDGQIGMKKTLNSVLNNYIRPFVYQALFNRMDIGFKDLFLSEDDTLLHRATPRHSRLCCDCLDFCFRLLIPHVVTIMVNHSEMSNVVLRISIYVVLTACRVVFLLQIIIYLTSKANII